MTPDEKQIAEAVFTEMMKQMEALSMRLANLAIDNARLRAKLAELEVPKE